MAQSKQDAARYLEVEAKLWVPNLVAVAARLAQLGAIARSQRTFERNVRYEDAARTLTPAGIVLRLRQDNRVRLTYKRPPAPADATDPDFQARFEAEVVVDDFDTMDVILMHLGFQAAMVYEKYRTTYELHGTEVVLDEMPYGHFVEVEGSPEDIRATLEVLGLADHTRFAESYARLFDYVRANLGLTFNDLTFDNFEGIDVPAEAFRPPKDGS